MRATRSATAFLSVVLGLLVALALAIPSRAEDEPASGDPVNLLCEAWRVSAPAALGTIESITEQGRDGAEAIRRLLLDGGGERIARVLAPAAAGVPMVLSDIRRIPLRVTVPQGGAVTGGFAGFQELGAEMQLVQRAGDAGTVEIEMDLKVRGAGTSEADAAPGTQTTTQLSTTIVAQTGAFSMFVSRVGDGDAVVVFVRASTLGEEAVRLEQPEAGGGGFSEAEIERFEALKALVDQRERKERLALMIQRQLERIGVELTDAQRAVVVEMTVAYREAQRERLRSVERGDRAAMQAAMEEVRQSYADGLATVLDEATVEKVVDVLGRYPGFGRERER